ncbi:MAG: antirestriction protein ArdA, partial [Clostridia bacterium]|nr:antirestriction protein ArdA [Clostridia bacterium]
MSEEVKEKFTAFIEDHPQFESFAGLIDLADNVGDPAFQPVEPLKPPIEVYIGNVHDDGGIGGFTIPLPTTMEKLQPFLDDEDITGWQDIEILEVMSDIDGLGNALDDAIKKTMSKDTLDELNYLAARIGALQGGNGHEMFAAAIETKRYNGSVAEIIDLTFPENLNRFDLMPAFTDEQYGEFLIDFAGDEYADAFNRLDNSDAEGDAALARHIEKLEKYVDKAAFGRDAIKEENGVLTDKGLLLGGDGIESVYHGSRDIPAEHRIFTEPGEICVQPMKLDDADIAATIVKLHAVYNGKMELAAHNIQTLLNGQDRDYLLLLNRGNIIFFPATEAYQRGSDASAIISSERPDATAFAVRINNRGENSVRGDLLELNGKALCANTSRHGVAPDRIDAVFSSGASKSYDLWSWAELPPHTREYIKSHEAHYPDSELANAARRYASFMGAHETVSVAAGVDGFLT